MELKNVYEHGLILDFEEWKELKETEQEKYFTNDDFVDCDHIKHNGELAINFIVIDGNVFYIIMPEFEDGEDYFKKLIKEFLSDDFKDFFVELDTWNITKKEQEDYKNTIAKNDVLFWRGGVGYHYGVHKYIGKNIKKVEKKEVEK